MKKKLVILIVIVFALLGFVGCEGCESNPIVGIKMDDGAIPLVFELNEEWDASEWYLYLIHEDGTLSRRVMNNSMISGLSTEEAGTFVMTVTYGKFSIEVEYQVKPEPVYLEVSFEAGYDIIIESQTVLYGQKVTEPQFEVPEGLIFLGWYRGEDLYDFNLPVIESFTLVARYENALDALKLRLLNKMEGTYKEVINNSYLYESETLEAIIEAYNQAKEAINAAETEQEAYDGYDIFAQAIGQSKTYIDMLKEVFETYNESDYFPEDWALLVEIYDEAMLALEEYEGGAPIPATIVEQAESAMADVVTMAEDIELAEYEKTIKLRDLENYYNAIDVAEYTDEKWAEVTAAYEAGIEAIKEAVGTRAVAAAYSEAIAAIEAVEKLSAEVLEAMAIVNEYYDSLSADDYFEEDFAVITAIYEEAIEAIRAYSGGAPMPGKIAEDAVKAMDDVPTMAEDIELAEYEKNVKLRDLKNIFNSYSELEYDSENWAKLVEWYEGAVAAINEAVGTRAVAAAYAAAVESIPELEKIDEALIAEANAFQEYFNSTYFEEDYFAEQWAEVIAIRDSVLEGIRNYVGGAPSVETIVEQGKAALENVVTKAEDIELAEYEKTVRIRDIENIFNGYTEFECTSEDWAALTAWYENSVNAINEAVGTHAVAAAYAAALEALPQIEKIDEALTAEANAFAEYFNSTYFEEDYFAEQWAEVIAIRDSVLNSIRDYIGGAPNIETIVSQGKAALENVVTMEEDIELAEYEKTIKIRDLQNYVNALDSESYDDAQWAAIQSALEEGIANIQNAVGTKAVAEAYEAAIEAIEALI